MDKRSPKMTVLLDRIFLIVSIHFLLELPVIAVIPTRKGFEELHPSRVEDFSIRDEYRT